MNLVPPSASRVWSIWGSDWRWLYQVCGCRQRTGILSCHRFLAPTSKKINFQKNRGIGIGTNNKPNELKFCQHLIFCDFPWKKHKNPDAESWDGFREKNVISMIKALFDLNWVQTTKIMCHLTEKKVVKFAMLNQF
jgi:hypothetical protein